MNFPQIYDFSFKYAQFAGQRGVTVCPSPGQRTGHNGTERDTYLSPVPLVNDISILYVFQPCFLLRKVMAEIGALCGMVGMKDV